MPRSISCSEVAFAAVLGAALSACGARTDLFSAESRATGDGGTDSAPGDVTPFCDGSAAKLIYGLNGVAGSSNALVAFDPRTASLRTLGEFACPLSDPYAAPWGIAVDHLGMAYVVFRDGELFKVSVADASCSPTKLRWPTDSLPSNGMSFVRSRSDDSETLYFATAAYPPKAITLATFDVSDGSVQTVATLDPVLNGVFVTGGHAGELLGTFLYFNFATGAFSESIAEIDPTDGAVLSRAEGTPRTSAYGIGLHARLGGTDAAESVGEARSVRARLVRRSLGLPRARGLHEREPVVERSGSEGARHHLVRLPAPGGGARGVGANAPLRSCCLPIGSRSMRLRIPAITTV